VATEAAPPTRQQSPPTRDTAMRVPRTTGGFSGVAIVVLGLWGALVPFVGPYFHYAFGNYDAWHFTTNRFWLDVLPGALAVIGGLLLLRAATRKGGLIGGWLALIAGGWFAVGPTVSLLWDGAGNPIGAPVGGQVQRTLELRRQTGHGCAALRHVAHMAFDLRPRRKAGGATGSFFMKDSSG